MLTAPTNIETIPELLALPCAAEVYSDGLRLVVNHRSDIGTDGQAAEVVLTGDGRRYDRQGWHEGPEAEWVRVERWTAEGRVFHGWIDSESRRLLQAG